MPRPVSIGVPCDVCQKDEYWDNTQNKKNPKAPDWTCANKECAGKDGYKFGRWNRDRAKWDANFKKSVTTAPSAPVAGGGPNPQGGRLTPDDTTPDEQGRNVPSWDALTFTYGKLYKAVYGVICQHVGDKAVDQNAVQAGVATLLIQGEKAHIPLLHPRKVTKEDVQKPEPKKAKPPVDEDEWERVDADRSELPF